MNATRAALIFGALIILHAAGYWIIIDVLGLTQEGPLDAAGTVMFIGLGLAMGFGGYVLVRGARDL